MFIIDFSVFWVFIHKRAFITEETRPDPEQPKTLTGIILAFLATPWKFPAIVDDTCVP